MRSDPKGSLEGDLKAVLVGIVITFMGSVLVAGAFYWTVFNAQPGPAMPVLGTIIFFIGGAVILSGLVLAILCFGVNFWYWSQKDPSQQAAVGVESSDCSSNESE